MISSTANKAQATGNGSTTSFNFPYMYLSQSNLVVTVRDPSLLTDSLKVLGSDYTVSVTGFSATGGNVVFTIAPVSGAKITIVRNIPLTQLLNLTSNDQFPSAAMETQLDVLTMICQQLAEVTGRCLQFPPNDVASMSPILPGSQLRANLTLKFDSSGIPIPS